MQIRSANAAGEPGKPVEVEHHPRRRLNYSEMRTHRAEDPRLPGERLEEAGKERGDDDVEELSDETWILNRQL